MTGNEINLQNPPNLDPVYSNMTNISFNDDEFTMIFVHRVMNQAKAKAIVSISPSHAKKLLAVLQESIRKYEEKLGSIKPEAQTETGSDGSTLQGYS